MSHCLLTANISGYITAKAVLQKCSDIFFITFESLSVKSRVMNYHVQCKSVYSSDLITLSKKTTSPGQQGVRSDDNNFSSIWTYRLHSNWPKKQKDVTDPFLHCVNSTNHTKSCLSILISYVILFFSILSYIFLSMWPQSDIRIYAIFMSHTHLKWRICR